MAITLTELYHLRYDKEGLQHRVAAAILQSAWDITVEDSATANHANRVAWAHTAIEGDLTQIAYEAMGWVCRSNNIQNNGNAASDNAVKNAVVEAIPNLVPALIPVRPDMATLTPEQTDYVVALEAALGIG